MYASSKPVNPSKPAFTTVYQKERIDEYMAVTETWSAKLDVETKQKLNELIAAWRDDPTEPTTDVVDRIIVAAQTAGNSIPSEVLEATGTVKDTVVSLLKQINGIGSAAGTAIDDLHSQLDNQIEQNNQLQEKMQAKIDQIEEGNKIVVQGLKDRIAELKNDNDRFMKEATANADALEGYKSSTASLTDQLAGSKDEIEKLKEQLRIAGQKLQQSENQLNGLATEYKQELNQLKNQHKAAVKAKVEQQKQVDEADFQRQLAEVKAATSRELSEKLEKLHEKIEKINDEKLDLVKENGNLKARCDEFQRQLVALQQQLTDSKKSGKLVEPSKSRS